MSQLLRAHTHTHTSSYTVDSAYNKLSYNNFLLIKLLLCVFVNTEVVLSYLYSNNDSMNESLLEYKEHVLMKLVVFITGVHFMCTVMLKPKVFVLMVITHTHTHIYIIIYNIHVQ